MSTLPGADTAIYALRRRNALAPAIGDAHHRQTVTISLAARRSLPASAAFVISAA